MRRRRRRTKQWEHKHTFLRQILTHKLNTHTHKQESYHPSSKCPISSPDYLPTYLLPITTFLIHYLPPKWNQIFANSITYYLLPITCNNNNTQTFHPHARQRRRRRRLRQFQFYYSQQAHFLSLLLSHLPTLSLFIVIFCQFFCPFSSFSPNCASVILSLSLSFDCYGK